MSASTNQAGCHCGRPGTHTESSPYMDDYCDECTLSRCDIISAADCPHSLNLPLGWEIEGPKFKDAEQYLSKDGDNPEAPWPGYGWPLGSQCWYYILNGHGRRLFATGRTTEGAARRAEALAAEHGPSRRRMGQPDAMAICETCKLTIDRQWWGNGGWLWVHRNGSVDCYPRAQANPADGTVKELFPRA